MGLLDLWDQFREAPTVVQVSCAAAGAALAFKAWRKYQERESPPTYSPGVPFVGGTIAFLRDPIKMVSAGYHAKGSVFRVNILTKDFCFLIGPEAQRPFFTHKDQILDQAKLYSFTVPVFGPGVVYDVDWPTRKEQFGFIRERFAAKNIDSYVPLCENEAKAYFSKLEMKKGWLNIREEMMQLITYTSSLCLMGEDIRSRLDGDIIELLHDLEQGIQSYSAAVPYLPTPKHRRRDAARKKLGVFFTNILEERRSGVSSAKSVDIIDRWLATKYKDGRPLTDEEICGMCVAAFFGGMHNSSITTTWTLLHIHHHRELLPRIRDEQVRARNDDGSLDFQALQKMHLLRACVKEVLRMYPPLVLLMRTVEQPFKACGYTVPKGNIVVTCPPVGHRVEEVFKNANEYNPDRWLDSEGLPLNEKSEAAFSFIPFGDGARRCLGEHFGYLQIMTVIAHFLWHYDMEVLDGIPKYSFQGMVVGPEGDCRVTVRRR